VYNTAIVGYLIIISKSLCTYLQAFKKSDKQAQNLLPTPHDRARTKVHHDAYSIYIVSSL
jgi:hypothetical protein